MFELSGDYIKHFWCTKFKDISGICFYNKTGQKKQENQPLP